MKLNKRFSVLAVTVAMGTLLVGGTASAASINCSAPSVTNIKQNCNSPTSIANILNSCKTAASNSTSPAKIANIINSCKTAAVNKTAAAKTNAISKTCANTASLSKLIQMCR